MKKVNWFMVVTFIIFVVGIISIFAIGKIDLKNDLKITNVTNEGFIVESKSGNDTEFSYLAEGEKDDTGFSIGYDSASGYDVIVSTDENYEKWVFNKEFFPRIKSITEDEKYWIIEWE